MKRKNLQNLVVECPQCRRKLDATDISPIDGDSEYLIQCPDCSTTIKFSFFTSFNEEGGESPPENKEYSRDYPLGGMAEPYDIQKERELCEE